jgi:hypothetical protein
MSSSSFFFLFVDAYLAYGTASQIEYRHDALSCSHRHQQVVIFFCPLFALFRLHRQ